MRVLVERPPIWDAILAKFPHAGRGAIFAWGGTIYNPSNIHIAPEVFKHEEVHGRRQVKLLPNIDDSIDWWWKRYISEAEFRLEEELIAHCAEYLSLIAQHGDNRNSRRYHFNYIARRLAAPLYQYKVPLATTKVLLREALDTRVTGATMQVTGSGQAACLSPTA